MSDSETERRAAVQGVSSSRRALRTGSACRAAPATIIALGLAIFAPAYARAQDTPAPENALHPASGLVVTPYVSLQTVYDSNIFATAGQRESDTILRLSPGIGLGYRSERSTFNLLYNFDAERFSRHSDLNSWDARQSAYIGGTYAFTRKFTGGLSADYLESYYPGELAPVSGLELTRTRATRVSVRPTLTYDFDPRTSATVFYDRAREHVAGGLTTYITTASTALSRNLTRKDQLTLQYQYVWYDFSSGTSPVSRLFSLGWKHDFSRETSFFVTAGPRDTDGRTIADVTTGIRHDAGWASQTYSYTRSQMTLAGQSGVYDTHEWEADFGFRPAPRWYFEVTPAYYRVSRNGQEAKAYSLGLTGRYWFARDWSLAMNYQYGNQQGVLGTTAGNDALILRNVVSLSLTWALPSGPGHAVLPSRQGYGARATGTGE